MLRTFLVLAIVGAQLWFLGAPAEADFEDDAELVVLINQERIRRGRAPLALYWDLKDDAKAHAVGMAGRGIVFHSPDLGSTTSGWQRLAENVAAGHGAGELFRGMLSSPSHAANILGDFNYLGVGVATGRSGLVFAAMIFMKAPGGLAGYSPPFRDDDGSPHEADITKVFGAKITNGCAPERYCPNQAVTRAEMAAFLVRALDLPGTRRDHFSDDAGHPLEASINVLAEAGITSGCAAERYCPNQAVTRAEMAAFLVRGFDLPGTRRDHFSDDAGHPLEASINALAEAGITSGCAAERYCPGRLVTRGQMASFLSRALGP
ncbi:MAG: S-layer homology domain-containing protein [Actinomycetota bacterium]|nr:S-layer homology domain-containing protein [Actinomycetota bacterium]